MNEEYQQCHVDWKRSERNVRVGEVKRSDVRKVSESKPVVMVCRLLKFLSSDSNPLSLSTILLSI